MTHGTDESAGHGMFSPYGRRDPRALAITEADARLLAGAPAALRLRIPVVIEDTETDQNARPERSVKRASGTAGVD
jgi:hypothetical protein